MARDRLHPPHDAEHIMGMPDGISTRPITRADGALIATLHTASWKVAYRGILSDAYLDGDILPERTAAWEQRMRDLAPTHYGFIAESGGRPVGFVFLRAAHDATWGTLLDNLHVVPEMRGKGVGRVLVAAAARETLRREPDRGVYLWVFEANHASRGFYRRIGGREAELMARPHPGAKEIPEWRVVWRSPQALLEGATERRP